ncbi:MAG: glycoside hydrolase family 3 N-terminal domain-containing protein [Ignavibacteriaceae bacterium]
MNEKLIQYEQHIQEDLLDYKNPKLPVENRVADLLSRMTTEEKVAQMICIWGQKKTILFDEDGHITFDKLGLHLANGIGQIGRLSDTNGGLNALEMAQIANSLQKYFVEETRLGIPVIFHEECLHGLVAKDATSYPQPIGLASTFNPELVEDIFTAIASETRARGAHQALTPVLDVARDARWGRVEETFGEDPYLISRMGIAAVKGLQGDGEFNDKNRLIATLKHFAAHGQPESGSNCGPANFSERVLRDTYFFPFKEVIKKGNAKSIMASYNEIDGVPSHANKWLLKDVLRDEWKFNGYIVSDYYAITELFQKEDTINQSLAKDKSEAALLSVNAGVNIELPDPDCYPNLLQLVQSGKLSESVLDKLVSTLLTYKFKLGLFDGPYIVLDSELNELKIQKNRKIALRAAHETITLLKNENGLLPLKVKKGSTLAVIGPNADKRLLGGYSGKPKYYTTVLQGIKEKVGSDINVLYGEGCKITMDGSWDEDSVILPDPEDDLKSIRKAITIAKKADTVILVLGENEQISREAWTKNHLGDRVNLELFGMQNELVKAILKVGKPVVVLLFNGRPNSFNYVNNNVSSILECWYLGQETGLAVADVLFGNYNPGGKLPISIPRSVGHIPCHYNYKPSARRGYLFDDISALYPFGYGLSYTTFRINNLSLKKAKIKIGEPVKVYVDIKNTGKRAGTEVVQMYIRDVVSSVTRPVKELKGFNKIHLKPGESTTIQLTILPEHLAFTDINKKYTIEPGEFEIMVGNSSRDEDLTKVILTVSE